MLYPGDTDTHIHIYHRELRPRETVPTLEKKVINASCNEAPLGNIHVSVQSVQRVAEKYTKKFKN